MNSTPIKTLILSDLHFEYSGTADLVLPSSDTYDLVILAGDIDLKCRGVEWAKKTFPDRPCIYIPGNHEFWGRNLYNEDRYMRQAAAGSNVNYLNMDEVIIHGIRFFGATCWTDFQAWPEAALAMAAAEAGKNMYSSGSRDYRKITSVGYRKLRAYETVNLAMQTKAWLKQKLAEPFEGKTVIVTHHAPTTQSLKTGKVVEILDACDANDWDDFIIESQVRAWIHGHTHNSVDLQLGKTQVISNASGGNGVTKDGNIYHYNKAFSTSFIVEL